MEEDLKILEKLKDKVLVTKTKTEYALTLHERAALDYLIEKHKEQQIKIEMAYRKGKEEATSELTIVKEKLLEENTLENINLKKEIEKKDKIIDEMANELELLFIKSDKDCFIPVEYSNINDCARKESCSDCIKQYFEKKVESK